ncbi:MAG: MotA/TolQ/ExbB proton channel family protein, partial [Bacteroidota bacterium]|nr:MotA/TolQ/ExbB proton channel family protein [Bacteroidota bacterium]
MKKILFALILSVFASSLFTTNVFATTTVNSVITIQDSEDEPMMEATSDEASAGFTQELKKRFIEGGPSFMGIVL